MLGLQNTCNDHDIKATKQNVIFDLYESKSIDSSHNRSRNVAHLERKKIKISININILYFCITSRLNLIKKSK